LKIIFQAKKKNFKIKGKIFFFFNIINNNYLKNINKKKEKKKKVKMLGKEKSK
jgi:hypothetical protein